MRTLPWPLKHAIQTICFLKVFPDGSNGSNVNSKESRCFFQYLLDSRWADECMAKAFFNSSSCSSFSHMFTHQHRRGTHKRRTSLDWPSTYTCTVHSSTWQAIQPSKANVQAVTIRGAGPADKITVWGLEFFGRGISCDDIPLTCWGQNRSERCELWPKRIDFLIRTIHDPIKISLISFQSSCAVQESSGNNYDVSWDTVSEVCCPLHEFGYIGAFFLLYWGRLWQATGQSLRRWQKSLQVGRAYSRRASEILLHETCWEVWNTYGSSAGSGSCSIPIYYKHRRIELASWQAQINYYLWYRASHFLPLTDLKEVIPSQTIIDINHQKPEKGTMNRSLSIRG